ncbi:hypothetical protein O1W69_03125 [Chlamydia sp. 12-01]|uniref:hypothetical protein n=1 Tax=Chlamydia sp. 12-01 TaxID=3002742 RepID=UPI0035D4CABE
MSSPSSSSSSAGSPEPAAECPFRNWTRPVPNPTPAEVVSLSQRIGGFVDNYIPLTGDGCLKRIPGCSSCPPGACIHSGRGEPMMDLCHCWTCCFGKPTGNSMRNFYINLKEYARLHGDTCAAHSLLKSGINVGVVSKQHGELSEEEKEQMQRCCRTELSAVDKRHISITARTRSMMKLADNIREEGILEGISGKILDLWHAAPEDTDPEDAQKVWIKTSDGSKSPFCFAKCLNYLRTIRCYRTINDCRGHNFLFRESPGSSIASCVMYTLAAMVKNENFRDLLLEEEPDGAGGTIYTCSYELVKTILLLSIVARNKHPHAGYTDRRRQFEEEDADTIILASNTFRERVLGKLIFDRHGTQIPQAILREFPTLSMNTGLKPWSRVTSTQPDPSTIFGPEGSGESSGEEEDMPETPPPPRRQRRRRRPSSSSSEASSTSSDSSPSSPIRPSESSSPSAASTRRLSVSSTSTFITVGEDSVGYVSDVEQIAATYPISIPLSPRLTTPRPSSPQFRITSSPLPSPQFYIDESDDESSSSSSTPTPPTIDPGVEAGSPEMRYSSSEGSLIIVSDSEEDESIEEESGIQSPITISSDSPRSSIISSVSPYLSSYTEYESNSTDSWPIPSVPPADFRRPSFDYLDESSTSEATPSTPSTPKSSPWGSSPSPEQPYTSYFSGDSEGSTSPQLRSPRSPLSSNGSQSPRVLRISTKTGSVMLGSPCSYRDSTSTTPTSSPRRSPVFSYFDDTSSSGETTITLASPGSPPLSSLGGVSPVTGSSIPGSSSDEEEQEAPVSRPSVIQTVGDPHTGADESSSRKRSADSESGEGSSSQQPTDEPGTDSTTTPGDSRLPPRKRWRNWQPT